MKNIDKKCDKLNYEIMMKIIAFVTLSLAILITVVFYDWKLLLILFLWSVGNNIEQWLRIKKAIEKILEMIQEQLNDL